MNTDRRDPSGELFVGFDCGGTQLKYGLVDREGEVVGSWTTATPADTSDLIVTLKGLWSEIQRGRKPIRGAGFGFPGIYSHSQQIIVQSPHFAALEGLQLKNELSRILDIPFILDNEANLAAYGEYAVGAGQGAHSLVLITIGSGIGTGIVLEGRIWRGASGFAGELGHVPINPSGSLCRCGKRGCLETEVSASRLVWEYRQLSDNTSPHTAEEVCSLAREGDPAALEAFAHAGRALGMGVALAINLLNPALVLLGGGVMQAGDLILGPAREAAAEHSIPASFRDCRIKPAGLGNEAGFVGAALYARKYLETDI